MALPVLNNSNSIANLPMDANSISQAVLTAASRTGHLQIYNNGTIAFNNNITGGSAPTATKESGGLGYSGISILSEIRNYLESINGNITRFVETSQRQTEITKNLLEAQTARTDIEAPRTTVQEKGMDFKQTFQDFFDNMKDSFSGISGGMKGGLMGGMLGGLFRGVLSSVGGFLLRGFGAVFAGYLIAKGIGKIPIGGGKTVGDKVEELATSLQGEFEKFVSSAGGEETSPGGFAEPGENADVGGRTAPSSAPAGGTAPSSAPAGDAPTTTREAPASTTTPAKTSTPAKKIITNNKDVATEADLTGIKFQFRKNNPDKNIVRALAQRLQYIRKKLGGKTLFINSGFRTKKHNRDVRGKSNSFHLLGWAADVSKQSIGSTKDQILFIKAAVEAGIGGVGFYDSFIHIDIRPRKGGRISRWNENKFPKEALNIINNPGKYTMDESVGVVEEKEETHKEENENKDTSSVGKQQDQQPTQDQSSPSTGNVPQQKEPTADRVESPPTTRGEEEEEGEETNERVQEDPSLKNLENKTAVKVNKNKNPNKYPEDIEKLFVTVEEKYKLPKGLLRAIAETETGPIGPKNTLEIKSRKVSNKGAKGLMQFMPGTAEEVGLNNPHNPKASIVAAGKYLGINIPKQLKTTDEKIIKNPKILAAAYNAGAGNVRKAGYKVPNLTETKNYVTKVARYMGTSSGSDTMLVEQQPSTEGGAARPSTEQQEPQTFEDTAKEVGEAVAETAEEAWEWTKEKFGKLVKDFGPDRNTLNKVLSAGINEIYDIAGVDKRKRVKIEGNKVVPYTEDPSTKNLTAPLIGPENTAKTGDAIYNSSAGVKTGEQQLTFGKVDATKSSAPTVINNVSSEGKQKGDNPNGVMGAVPNVRQKTDSTLEEIQYRNFRGTGVV